MKCEYWTASVDKCWLTFLGHVILDGRIFQPCHFRPQRPTFSRYQCNLSLHATDLYPHPIGSRDDVISFQPRVPTLNSHSELKQKKICGKMLMTKLSISTLHSPTVRLAFLIFILFFFPPVPPCCLLPGFERPDRGSCRCCCRECSRAA